MKNRGLRHIPIVDKDSKPLGIIYARDALQTLLTEVQDEEELLRDYVMCAGYH
jgi:CBS domain-containing protein